MQCVSCRVHGLVFHAGFRPLCFMEDSCPCVSWRVHALVFYGGFMPLCFMEGSCPCVSWRVHALVFHIPFGRGVTHVSLMSLINKPADWSPSNYLEQQECFPKPMNKLTLNEPTTRTMLFNSSFTQSISINAVASLQ